MDQVTVTIEERERRIEDAERNNYLVRGRELAAIRDDHSWRQRYNCTTFEEYCEQRWELAKAQSYRLMDAAAFADKVPNWGLMVPTRESHIRPLIARLEADDDRLAVWRDELVASIRSNGLQQKIVLSSDRSTIIDGRNRFLACAAAGRSPSFRELPGAFSEEKTIQFIIAANLHRRQLTVGQRAALGVGIEEALAKITRAGRPENGKKVANSPQLSEPKSRDKAAAQVGVGGRAIQDAKKIKEVSPALFQQVVAGTTTLNDAHKKAKAEEKAKMADRPAHDPKPATNALATNTYAAARIFSISRTAFAPQPSLPGGTSGLNFS
jgi:hypothetical protein